MSGKASPFERRGGNPASLVFLMRFLFIFFFSFSALALEESQLPFVYKLLEEKSFYSMGDFYGEGQTRLRYAQFGKRRGEKGALIFVNGKGENLLKYIELFYDFYLQGWSPLYTYDHRGQGFSQRLHQTKTRRLLQTKSRSLYKNDSFYVDSTQTEGEIYSLYKKDLRAFIRFVLNKLDRSNLFLIAHSMGGTVVLDYLQTHNDENPFKAIALSAPMVKINSPVPPLIESPVLFSFRAFCSFFPCDWSFFSVRNHFQNELTTSLPRYAFSKYVEEVFPQAKPRGASLQWIIESFKIGERITKQGQKIKTPLLILQSEKDILVSNESQDLLCKQWPGFCRLQKIEGKHELFLETDSIRNQTIKEITSFFLSHPR